MNKRYDRLIFSIASIFTAYGFLKEFAFQQKHYILGIFIFLVFIGLAIMWLDLSGILLFKINKNYVIQNKYIDVIGCATVLYLFVKAVL